MQRVKTIFGWIGKKIRAFFHRKRLIRYGVYLSVLLLLFLFRYPLMRQMARHLMADDALQQSDYCFVLGGNSYDRGMEAVKLYREGWIRKIVCTSENVPAVLDAIGNKMTEAEVTAFYIRKEIQIPDENLIVINQCTSTREEAVVISRFCKEHAVTHPMVLSSRFHLRRVRNVFTAENPDMKWNFHGAPNSKFNELEWWKSEEGMIAINNEYMKLFYYWLTD